MASCSWDNGIGLWDVQTGHLLQTLKGHTSPVAACSFTVGGGALVGVFVITIVCLRSLYCRKLGVEHVVFDVRTIINTMCNCLLRVENYTLFLFSNPQY